MRICLNPARDLAVAAAVAAGLLSGPPVVEGAPPLDPPALFWTRGEGAMTIRGPHCCGTTRFSGRFVAQYGVDSAGNATLGRLSLELDDLDIVVRGGFLDLFSRLIQVRCATFSSTAPAAGRFDGTSRVLEFGPGTVSLVGFSAEERLSPESCADPTLRVDAVNDEPLRFFHDPAGNHFGLDATLHATAEGDRYEMVLHLDGAFLNRPPVAVAAMVTPALPQGGCPARWWWNGQQWVPVAEANDPSGLVGAPYSMSGDPDGAWRHGDVSDERWFLSAGDGDRTFLGDGPRLPTRSFGWGPDHRLELLASDPFGASSASVCRFRVVDTTAPAVTPPAPLVTGCSQPGGASASTSSAVRAFLSGARAGDIVDRAPRALPPQAGGANVTDTTLFRLGATPVSFRFRDFSTNVGAASSTLTVRDATAPTVSLSLVPAAMAPTLTYQRIAATLTASDDCGGPVTLRLVSITSNAPVFDAHDIVDATVGADDRVFYLFGRLAAPGVARLYKVVYEGKDAAGNSRMVSGIVVVS